MKIQHIARTISFSILCVSCFAQNVFSQAPTISYSGPQTYAVGSNIAMLNPTVTGSPIPYTGYTGTVSGTGSTGASNGTGTAASFNHPWGIAVDGSGNQYIADFGNNLIRKITPAGVVTTFAGSGAATSVNGTGTAASFNGPMGLAADASGNIYVAEYYGALIRKISPAGVVTTLAGSGTNGNANGTGTAASFQLPAGVAVDAAGNVYVADSNNCLIRKITAAGVVTTLAGSGSIGSANGTGTAASFHYPYGIACDLQGDVFVADRYNNLIRTISPAGVVTTLAGSGAFGATNGIGTAASFDYPGALAVDVSGNVYVADQGNQKIRMITPAGVVTNLAGTGAGGSNSGEGSSATFNSPQGIAVSSIGNLYVCDYATNLIRSAAFAAYVPNQPLPAGLSFNGLTGAISGKPSVVSASTSYTVAAYNTSGTGSGSVNLTVNSASLPAPSSNQNYVVTYIPRVAGLTTGTAVTTASGDNTEVETNVQYIDGLGRPVQTVQVRASPTGKDVVQPYVYDSFSRDSVKYLPYTINTPTPGAYQATATADASGYTGSAQYQFYQQTGQGYVNTTYPYSGTNFEPSPLDRPVEEGAPGTAWQLSTTGITGSGHTVKLVYTQNNSTSFAADSVNGSQVVWYNASIRDDQSRTLGPEGFYPAGQLTVTISKGENWVSGRAGTVEEYKDKTGRVLLKRQYNYTTSLQMLSTYYVYDDMDQLAFVIPPAANGDAGEISQATLDNLCYQYRYDERGRLTQKKIPGKGWEFTVYNSIDKVVLTQDANQRKQSPQIWIFTKYDALGRTIMTGIWQYDDATGDSSVRTPNTGYLFYLQSSEVPSASALWEDRNQYTSTGYTSNSFPSFGTAVRLEISYYDDYSGIPNLPAAYSASAGTSVQTRGLPTATLTAVLNTPSNMLWAVHYYDDLGRNIKSYTQHYLAGTLSSSNYDAVSTTYNFTNAPTTITRQHWNTTSTTYPLVTIANTYLYDQVGRKIKTWEQITNGNNSPTAKTLISQIDYNEIGQVLNKHLHSTDSVNFYQTITYAYNERGWLLTSSAPLFALQLYYNTGTNKAYNGNIMYQYWGTPGNFTNNFSYTYDKLNRLIAGNCYTSSSENNITYDLMGNIASLNRYIPGPVLTDQLSYTYTSGGNVTNQLQSIVDASGSNTGLASGTTNYTYDGNGNMLSATNTVNTGANKSVTYNLLNLPQSATTPNGNMLYIYDAEGNKLRKQSGPLNNNTDYIAGIQYDGTTTPSLSFIQTEEGKAVPNGTGYDYVYYLGDNLGNTRITFGTKTGAAVTYQSDDYYPFGMEISNSVLSPKNEYLYNKKELQEELQEYDYGARFYDPVIGRFTTIDPAATHFPWLTSYQYASNNPVSKVDLDGLEGIFFSELPFLEESGLTPENIAKAGGDVASEEEETATPTNDHHVSPNQSKNDPFVKEAREGGFKQDGAENKIKLDKYNKATGEGEHGNHPNYNQEMQNKIDQLKENNPNTTPKEKAELLRNLVKEIKELINNNRGTKINDLFKTARDATKTVIPVIIPPKPKPKPKPATSPPNYIYS